MLTSPDVLSCFRQEAIVMKTPALLFLELVWTTMAALLNSFCFRATLMKERRGRGLGGLPAAGQLVNWSWVTWRTSPFLPRLALEMWKVLMVKLARRSVLWRLTSTCPYCALCSGQYWSQITWGEESLM